MKVIVTTSTGLEVTLSGDNMSCAYGIAKDPSDVLKEIFWPVGQTQYLLILKPLELKQDPQ